MKKQLSLVAYSFVVGLLIAAQAKAADLSVGEKAYIGNGCIACHGKAGNSLSPNTYPKIAGLERDYIIEQLNAFREGERSNSMMSPMAISLPETDIAILADYLAAQK